MASIETLILQIFDRKRQIIDQLKQHKLIYDQHLASKLFIQGISPPPWLLTDHFSNSSALDKAGLISGLLHSRPGHVPSCPGDHGFFYDKTVSVFNNSVSNGACAGNCASSTGCDEDASSVIPLCSDDVTDNRAPIVAPSPVENNACALTYVPMSPENQSDTRTCDTHPKQEQSLVKIQRSRSRQRALEIRKSAKTSSKSRLGITNNVGTPSQNKSCQGDEEKESIKAGSPNVTSCLLTQFTNNEVKEVHTGDNQKKETNSSVYVGRITRSSSQCQQSNSILSGRIALENNAQLDGSRELIESDKASALPTEFCSLEDKIRTCSAESSDTPCVSLLRDLTMNDNGGCPSENKSFEGDEEANGSIESLELATPFSASADICYIKEPPIKVRSPDSRANLLTLSINNKAKAVHGGDNLETKKSDIVYAGKITRSKSVCQQSGDVSSGSHRQYYSEQLHGSHGYIESHKAFELPATIYSPETSADLLTLSTNNEAKAVHGGDNLESKKNDIVFAGRITRSKSVCQQSGDVSSGSQRQYYSEQLRGSRGYIESHKAFELPATIYSSETSPDLLTLSTNNEAKTVHGGNNRETKKNDIVNAGRITRSKSVCQQSADVSSGSQRQYYSEQLRGYRGFIESDKAFELPATIYSSETSDACNASLSRDLGINNNVNVPSGNKNSQGYEQLNGIRESLELVEALSIPSKTCDEEEASTKLAKSSSRCQLFKDAPSGSKTLGSSGQLGGSREFLGPYKFSASPTEIRPWKEADVGPCLTKESCDASDISLTKSVDSADSKAKDVQTRDDIEENKSSSFTADRLTAFATGRQSSLGIPSTTKTSGHGQKIDDIRESMGLIKQTASPMGVFSKEEEETGKRKSEMLHHEDSGGNVVITMTRHKQLLASGLSIDQQRTFVETSDCYSKELEVETESGYAELYGATVSGMVNGQVVAGSNFSDKEKDWENSLQAVKKLKFSIVSPVIERMDVDEADQAMPEFESFGAENFEDKFLYDEIPLLSNIMEPSLHEHISRSACFSTPGSPLPAACKSSVPVKLSTNNDLRSSLHDQQCRSACLSTPSSPFPFACRLHLEPGIYSSVPNGLLENIDLRSNPLPVGGALQRKSLSDLISYPHNHCGQNFRKPFLSPVEIGFDSITSKSGSSEKLRSGNPELTCFTILEDPESSEEDVNEAKTVVEGIDLRKKSSSTGEPLCDITVKNNTSLVTDHVEKKSVESISTEISVSDICDVDSQVNGTSRRQSRRTTRGKENKGFSVGGNSFKKNSKALSSRFSKPKLSGQSNLRNRGQSMSEKEPKRNNIVSNVKSFIPLVQQKQAAAAAPVKRAVKVKALEAAEAAKLLAEKKENERKQKKEAQKAERARLKQESLKQLERIGKELKAQAKKKREAENAAKKRQREEEEKNEKERKRKRVEDARCQQKQAQEKIHAWREESRYGAEERTIEGKDLNKKAQKENDRENETRVSSQPVNGLIDGGIRMIAGDGLPTLSDNIFTKPSLVGKVDSVLTAESTTPNFTKSEKPASRNIEEQSYDISPYQCSDDEEEEDDEMPNKKFIPSWASKSCISLALSSMQDIDPDTIFPPGSFCSLDEVLVPKGLPQDSKK